MRRHLPVLVAGFVFFGLGVLFGTTVLSESDAEAHAVQSVDRVFEMRTYTANDGKLDDLHTRFRDHTIHYFEKHGMTNVGYWVPRESELSENTLVYILAYPSRDAAEQSWADFWEDTGWLEARAASEEDGALVANVESVFLDPTDYSLIR